MAKQAPTDHAKDIALSRDDSHPIYLQICARFKTAIAEGRLVPGDRMPSVRALASELGLSRGTINLAYQILAEEGYVEFRGAAGTFVDMRLRTPETAAPSPSATRHGLIEQPPNARPFQLGLPALDAFPRKTWSRLVSRCSRQLGAAQLGYPEPAGLMALRERIAGYLAFSRGIACRPEQVFVTAGHRASLELIMRSLYHPGDGIWFEDPGYPVAREFLLSIHAKLHPVPVDADGLVVEEGRRLAPDARFAIVTPANQSPLCVMMSKERRSELLKWAEEGQHWIVEDDYDSEYRYNRRPPLSLKAMDRGERVLFTGSFSKVLFPGLRLAYLVVPPGQIDVFERACRLVSAGCPEFHQSVVADFIEQGYFIRHLKKMRSLYAERRQLLVDIMHDVFGDRVAAISPAAGLHLVVQFQGYRAPASRIAALARAEGFGLQPLSLWYMGPQSIDGLLLGFTNITTKAMAATLAARLRDICVAADRED
ncbi:PLP-dependent aminotransferase family protein [Rhizobium lusitanum]|uniref:GntR family transcriptional regulator/MocR family aminotransferase n=1 Tax=Rhizobium lusitanum TaxID=293958 RepID=A0A7X0MA13_9HYPH|nr:PLP-dependent aminotransferase family protein [Rhizobium lusitanum]MBB6482994.1 GntR family transcriptional regulator/MocR family aminotransferase [Rhizobium lusitanum]